MKGFSIRSLFRLPKVRSNEYGKCIIHDGEGGGTYVSFVARNGEVTAHTEIHTQKHNSKSAIDVVAKIATYGEIIDNTKAKR